MDESEVITSATVIPGTKVETTWEYITPEMAAQYLDRNENNRNTRIRHLDGITEDMREERYELTHQGIAFNEEDILIDGQHRLQAIEISGKPQWLLVTRGLGPKAQAAIDFVAVRRAMDMLPGKHKAAREGAIRILLGIERCGNVVTAGRLGELRSRVTKRAIQENWTRWPEVEEWAGLSIQASPNVKVAGPSALIAAAVTYKEVGLSFLQGIESLAGLSHGDPRLALVKYSGVYTQGGKLQGGPSAVLTLKAAKALANNEEIKTLKLGGLSEKLYIR